MQPLNALIIGEFDHNNMSDLLSKSNMIGYTNTSTRVPLLSVSDYGLFVFTGGADVTPMLYGEKNTYSSIDPARDQYDLFYLRMADQLHKKIFGVCRGHQLINAYFGGKLCQDTRYSSTSHRYHDEIHRLIVRDDPVDLFPEMVVNSTHHQGVVVGAWDSMPLAFSPYGDNVIEANRIGNRVFSCQFHPEYSSFPAASLPLFLDYFNKFLSSNLYDYSRGA
jgi:putative glutamine amidotransferase